MPRPTSKRELTLIAETQFATLKQLIALMGEDELNANLIFQKLSCLSKKSNTGSVMKTCVTC